MLSVSDTSSLPLPVLGYTYDTQMVYYEICITLTIVFMLSVSNTSSLPLPVLGYTYGWCVVIHNL